MAKLTVGQLLPKWAGMNDSNGVLTESIQVCYVVIYEAYKEMVSLDILVRYF